MTIIVIFAIFVPRLPIFRWQASLLPISPR
jgi:hypothetical protein